MTPAELVTIVRDQTHTNSTTFTDSLLKTYWKSAQQQLVSRVRKTNSTGDDPYLIPHYQDLKDDLREYSFPVGMVRVKLIEADFDGDGKYIKLLSMDVGDYPKGITEADITNYFSNLERRAKYDVMTGGVRLFTGTIVDVTDGLRIWYERLPVVPTDLTSTREIDDIPLNATLSIGTTDDTEMAYSIFQYVLDYVGYYKTKGEVALATGTVPADKWGIWRFSIDVDGTITSTAGSTNTTGYADEATAIAALPSTPTGSADMGYLTVLTASGQAFIPSTDSPEGGGSGNVATTTNYYQSANNSRRVFGLQAGLHEVLATRIQIYYKTGQEKPMALTEQELSWKIDVIDAVNSVMGISEDDEIIGKLPEEDGPDEYNHGFNL